MKNALKILVLGAAVAASATAARADQLSGTLNFGPTASGQSQYSFTLSGDILSVNFNGGTTTTAGGNPIINAYASDAASMGNFSFNVLTGVMTSFSSPEFSVLDTNSNTYTGSTLSFSDTSSVPTATYNYNQSSGFLDITLLGTLTDNYAGSPALTATPATLAFSSQDVFFTPAGSGVYNSGEVSYSGTITANPAPEPSSLALLGTGLLGAAGAARRRFLRK